jgi:hypothetical protein
LLEPRTDSIDGEIVSLVNPLEERRVKPRGPLKFERHLLARGNEQRQRRKRPLFVFRHP